MSEALVRADEKFLIAFKASIKNKCPHGYIRGAQDLAAILAWADILRARDMGCNTQPNGDPPSDVIGKKGIICYMNVPGFGGQGHIDLWDGNVPVGDSYWDAKTIWMWALK